MQIKILNNLYLYKKQYNGEIHRTASLQIIDNLDCAILVDCDMGTYKLLELLGQF